VCILSDVAQKLGRGKDSGPLRNFNGNRVDNWSCKPPLCHERARGQKSELGEGVMTSQAKWFFFGAAVGLPVALLASQLHGVASLNVAVAVIKAQ
jgi:hypothetical protein